MCSAPSFISRSELGRAMERHGKGARRLQTALFRTDGKVVRIEIGTSRAAARSRPHPRLFVDRLAVIGDEADPGFGFDMIRLSALVGGALRSGADWIRRRRSGARDRASGRPADGALRRRSRAAARLPQDTHIPEFASLAVPAHLRQQSQTAFA